MMGIRARKILGLVLALVMLASGVLAESDVQAIPFESYAQAVVTDAQWESDGVEQIQMLSMDGEVTVSACLMDGNVAALTVEYPMGEQPESARQAIESLGWLEAEDLDAAFALTSEDMQEMNGFGVYHVVGKNREAVSICRVEDAEHMVWQPIHGGERIHNEHGCFEDDH